MDQDPAALGANTASASKKIVDIRYSLLPYLYTLFYQVNKNGGTVIRSLVHEFPTDQRTLEIDRQFMWGSALLISPVLERNTRTVYAYFPSARWFDFYTGAEVKETGRVHEINAPLDHLPLHVKGGSIIVTQEPGLNTNLSRKNPFGLIIAPDNQPNENSTFKTSLFYDNGDDLNYEVNSSIIEIAFLSTKEYYEITMKPIHKGFIFAAENTLDTIRLFSVDSAPEEIVLDAFRHHHDFEYNAHTKELTINNIKLKMLYFNSVIINK